MRRDPAGGSSNSALAAESQLPPAHRAFWGGRALRSVSVDAPFLVLSSAFHAARSFWLYCCSLVLPRFLSLSATLGILELALHACKRLERS